jgi:hypothetical protein
MKSLPRPVRPVGRVPIAPPIRLALGVTAPPVSQSESKKTFHLKHPPQCPVIAHSRLGRLSTQRCVRCSKIWCYKCESKKTGIKHAPPLLLHYWCATCEARNEFVGFKMDFRNNIKAQQALAELRAEEQSTGSGSGGGRARGTTDAHAGNILRMRSYIWTKFSLPSLPAPWTPAMLVSFIYHHVRLDHVWSCIAHYMSSMRRWIRMQAELLSQTPDLTAINSLRVRGALAYAQDVMPHQKSVRLPAWAPHLLLMLAPLVATIPAQVQGIDPLTAEAIYLAAPCPAPILTDQQWDALMDVWAMLHLAFSFIRRSRCAAVEYEYTPWSNAHVDEVRLETVSEQVEWHASLDDLGNPSIMVVGTKEKNFHARNRSKRFFSNDNVAGLPAASLVLWIAAQLRLEKGPLLRRRDGVVWGKTEFSAFADRCSLYMKIDRDRFGMTSFRRGLASMLRRAGRSEDQIAFLGWWTSRDGPKPYLGCERAARLDLLSLEPSSASGAAKYRMARQAAWAALPRAPAV